MELKDIEPGDAVAPHIYDWYFDGVDDVVNLGTRLTTVTDFTVLVWVAIVSHPKSWTGIAGNTIWTDRNWWIILGLAGSYGIGVGVAFTGGNVDGGVGAPGANVWAQVGLSKSGSTVKGYYNGVLRGTWVGSGDYRLDPNVRVGIGARNGGGRDPSNVMVSQFLFYTRPLSDTEVSWNYNNPYSPVRDGLVALLDATFYNGTHYIDLSGNGNHGVDRGGVSRVLSDRPGLYLVKGLHGDGLVHFRFFPVNTVVDVYDAVTNTPVTSFVIDGPANQAGMVEDYAVSLGPGTYRLAIYTNVYVQVAQPTLPAMKLVAAHFKTTFGPGCRVYIDYTAWPKAEPRAECGLQTDVVFLTGLPAGATVRVWNETTMYELTASSTGVVILGGLRHGEYEVKVYSDTLQVPYDHLLRLDPLTGLRQFLGFWDRLTYGLFTPVFVVGLVLAVYLRTWSAVLTALVALATHIVIAPDNLWIRGLLALALAAAIYIAVWRRTSPF